LRSDRVILTFAMVFFLWYTDKKESFAHKHPLLSHKPLSLCNAASAETGPFDVDAQTEIMPNCSGSPPDTTRPNPIGQTRHLPTGSELRYGPDIPKVSLCQKK